jgi:hypothetical protein
MVLTGLRNFISIPLKDKQLSLKKTVNNVFNNEVSCYSQSQFLDLRA